MNMYQSIRRAGKVRFERFKSGSQNDLGWTIVRRGIKCPNTIPDGVALRVKVLSRLLDGLMTYLKARRTVRTGVVLVK